LQRVSRSPCGGARGSRALAIEPGRKTVELPLFAVGENLLVARLDLLESDGLALLQPEPLGVRFGLLVIAAGHVRSLRRSPEREPFHFRRKPPAL
jgi:hypothetical protein